MSPKGFLPYKGRELIEKHKAPTQLPTNAPRLELQIFKKSIGWSIGGAIGLVVVFPLYSPPPLGAAFPCPSGNYVRAGGAEQGGAINRLSV